MVSQRIFAIPDIHGRVDQLEALIDKLDKEAKLDLTRDRLVFLGDMIDRGPYSNQVIERIRGMQQGSPNHVTVLAGNHEDLALAACDREEHLELWLVNGGGKTLESYGLSWYTASEGGIEPEMLLPKGVQRWLKALPTSYQQDGFFFSHAPLPKEKHRLKSNQGKPFTREELTWTYGDDEPDLARDMTPKHIGVCGHIHQLRRRIFEPRLYDHYYFLDAGAGCGLGAPLFAMEVKSKTLYSVQG